MDNLKERNHILFVTQLERCAVNDGPGIRTVVFLQGCPMHCPWCCNPETQSFHPVLMQDRKICVGCGICMQNCAYGNVAIKDGKASFNRNACRLCGVCVDRCPLGALKFSSHTMTVEEILSVVERDRVYYEETGGGLTLSGGEPFLQSASVQLLKRAKESGLHTCVETTLFVPREILADAMPYVDLFYVDAKHPDGEKLQKITGANPERICGNLKFLKENGKDITLRTPVIPGFNREESVIRKLFSFALENGIKDYVLLPYHSLGIKKYDMLGMTYPMGETEVLNPGDLTEYRQIGESMGLKVRIGG